MPCVLIRTSCEVFNMYVTMSAVEPQEAAASAGAETERRLRDEMEREKGLARGAEGSVLALSKRLEEALKEVSEKETAAAELRKRVEEVQVWEGGEFDLCCFGRDAATTGWAGMLLDRMWLSLVASRCVGVVMATDDSDLTLDLVVVGVPQPERRRACGCRGTRSGGGVRGQGHAAGCPGGGGEGPKR